MKEFDDRKKREEEEEKLKEGQPDNDGWITVTKQQVLRFFFLIQNIHTLYNCSSKHAARTETMEKKVMEKEKQKQKDKKLINFYSFQMRETKMERKSSNPTSGR